MTLKPNLAKNKTALKQAGGRSQERFLAGFEVFNIALPKWPVGCNS